MSSSLRFRRSRSPRKRAHLLHVGVLHADGTKLAQPHLRKCPVCCFCRFVVHRRTRNGGLRQQLSGARWTQFTVQPHASEEASTPTRGRRSDALSRQYDHEIGPFECPRCNGCLETRGPLQSRPAAKRASRLTVQANHPRNDPNSRELRLLNLNLLSSLISGWLPHDTTWRWCRYP